MDVPRQSLQFQEMLPDEGACCARSSHCSPSQFQRTGSSLDVSEPLTGGANRIGRECPIRRPPVRLPRSRDRRDAPRHDGRGEGRPTAARVHARVAVYEPLVPGGRRHSAADAAGTHGSRYCCARPVDLGYRLRGARAERPSTSLSRYPGGFGGSARRRPRSSRRAMLRGRRARLLRQDQQRESAEEA
jgi:hypothetical protein